MAILPAVAASGFSFLCVWLLLGFACGPGAMRLAARERFRLRLLGWASKLGLSRAAFFLSGFEPLTEIAALLARHLARKRFDIGVGAGCVLIGMGALLAVVLAGLIAQSWTGLVVGGVAVGVTVVSWGLSLGRARRRALQHEMPRVFRSLAGSLAAGRTLAQALASLSKNREISSPAYGRAALSLACGFSATDALMQLAKELDTPGGELLVSSLLVSHRTGSPLMGLFQRSAALVEREGELERLLAVKTAQVRLSVRVVCALPAVMVGILVLISPDFRLGLSTAAGRASIAVAALLDVLAIWLVRRLLASVI